MRPISQNIGLSQMSRSIQCGELGKTPTFLPPAVGAYSWALRMMLGRLVGTNGLHDPDDWRNASTVVRADNGTGLPPTRPPERRSLERRMDR
jgi:hypothetical protein